MTRIPVVLAAASLLLAACGTTAPEPSAAPGGAATLTITAPTAGATVTEPFPLAFTSNQEIGPPASGKHHVHVTVDGKTADYAVVTASPFQVKNLTPGEHTITVTLQNADHSPAGATTQVKVNITGGAVQSPTSSESPGMGDSGGGY